MEDRRLLAVYVTSLTGDAGGSYSNSASVSSQDLLGDTYRFTVGQGAAINVTVQSDASDPNAYFSVDLTDEPYGTAGDSNFYTGSGGTGTVTLATVTGDRSHYYYVSIQGSEFGSGTAVPLPYTVTITTGSGEPQPDLAINSAILNPYNNSIEYNYSATNDPGPYSIGVYLSPTANYVPTSDDQPLASQTITTGATSSSTGILNFGSVGPTTQDPYLSVYISGSLLENNYTNNVASITLPPLKSPDLTMDYASVSGTYIYNNDQRSLNIDYSIVGSDLPTLETMNLYWATGPSLSDALPGGKAGSAFFLAMRASSTVYTQSIAFKDAALGGAKPPTATWVLALANPPYADSTNNLVAAQIAATLPIPPTQSLVTITPHPGDAASGNLADFSYTISGAALSSNVKVVAYWATGPTMDDVLPAATYPPVTVFTIPAGTGITQGDSPFVILTAATLGTPPPAGKYLILQAVPVTPSSTIRVSGSPAIFDWEFDPQTFLAAFAQTLPASPNPTLANLAIARRIRQQVKKADSPLIKAYYKHLLTTYINSYTSQYAEEQKAGIEQLLINLESDSSMSDVRWAAYMLATAYHETGKLMAPNEEDPGVKKVVWPKNSTLPVAVPNLEYFKQYAGRYGNAKWPLPRPTSDAVTYRGRGYIHLTFKDNYSYFGYAANPDELLNPAVAYIVMSRTMIDGDDSANGKSLDDYIYENTLDYFDARGIINGDKKKVAKGNTVSNGQLIAGYAQAFDFLLSKSLDYVPYYPGGNGSQ